MFLFIFTFTSHAILNSQAGVGFPHLSMDSLACITGDIIINTLAEDSGNFYFLVLCSGFGNLCMFKYRVKCLITIIGTVTRMYAAWRKTKNSTERKIFSGSVNPILGQSLHLCSVLAIAHWSETAERGGRIGLEAGEGGLLLPAPISPCSWRA